MAERGWFGLGSHPGARLASFLTLSKSSSVGLQPGDFQPEEGQQSLALGRFKKESPKSFLGVGSFSPIMARSELVLRG